MIDSYVQSARIPTEPIGSIPRPSWLLDAYRAFESGNLSAAELAEQCEVAVRETIREFEATGSPVISDGEQTKFHNFATYSIDGQPNLSPDGFVLQFTRHSRRLPRIVSGPFRYRCYADQFLRRALQYASVPVKQAVIAPSALSLAYPVHDIADYPRDTFISELLDEHEREVKACLSAGAANVQIDFTEGRLACKIDPTGHLLNTFIQFNNLALDRLSARELQRVGVHTCPGGDRDDTHSRDVDYSELLPSLFELNATNFYIALAGESDRSKALKLIAQHIKPHQHAFVGVIDPLNPVIETPEQVCERVLEAAEFIPLAQLGTTDDCGFAPFCDDVSTTREVSFAKIHARVIGTNMASAKLADRFK